MTIGSTIPHTMQPRLPGKAAQSQQAPEVFTSSYGVSINTPIELTADGYKLPKPNNRIDSVQEVLSVKECWDKGYTGKGVGVAVLDTGIYPHPDIKDRLVEFVDFCNGRNGVENAYDDNGHGTHCAGLVGGDGKEANGRFKGAAPECNLIGVKVLDGAGGGQMSNVVKGIQWCIENKDRLNIKVMSLSLGAGSNLKEQHDIVAKAINAAIEAGITPVIAAGNSGPGKHTIGTPGIAKDALTVGAYDDKNTPTHDDDTMAFFSSRGPTTRDKHVKPDIAAPGVNMVSALSPESEIAFANVARLGKHYILLSGTSMATPVVAGCAALLHEADPELGPREAIQTLKETAEKMPDSPGILAGHGLVDPARAIDKVLADDKKAA